MPISTPRTCLCLLTLAAGASGCFNPAELDPRDGGLPDASEPAGSGAPDAGDCRLGLYQVTSDVLPATELAIAAAPDGGYVCHLNGAEHVCADRLLGTPGFGVYFDDVGYEILWFTGSPCGTPWTGQLLEMEIAGQPTPSISATRE